MTAGLRLRNVQLDVPSDGYDRAVAFWAAALDATTRAGDGPYTHLVGARAPVGVHLQRLDSGTARVHLDLDTDDIPGTTDRLLGLGAVQVGDGEAGPILQDPGGHVLCVCPAGLPVQLGDVEEGTGVRLHVVVLDTSSGRVDATAQFWSEALGVAARHLDAPYDAYIHLPDLPTPGAGIDGLVQDTGTDATPRVHLDLHVPEPEARDREVTRLVELGAQVLDDMHRWTVVRDPVGIVFCVVPDPAP